MRRGFKSEANRIAREVRQELSLQPSSPLNVWMLAEHLEIPMRPLSGFREEAPDAVSLFLDGWEEVFSGVTVFRGSRRMIVFNDAHVLGRQANDIAHELSHGLLLHSPSPVLDGRGCRVWDSDTEAEANWLSGALLISDEAALLIARRGWSMPQAADYYSVTPKMVQYRVNVTGAHKRVQRFRLNSRHSGDSIVGQGHDGRQPGLNTV